MLSLKVNSCHWYLWHLINPKSGNLSSIGKYRVLTPWVILSWIGSLRVLGVVVSSNLTMGSHLDELLSNCASSIHALRMLRTHGLQPPQLQEVARMSTVASLLYASPAWWGFTSAQDRDRLERMVGRLWQRGYLPSFAEMASKADKSLFRSITSNPGHVLSRFLPRVKTTGYNLRPRAHVYELPKKDNRNFM